MTANRVLNARTSTMLGQGIRRLRTERGLTQSDLAARAGVSRQWVIAAESGRNPRLEIGLAQRVLDELGASLAIRDDSQERR